MRNNSITIPGDVIGSLNYTLPNIPPSFDIPSDVPFSPNVEDMPVMALLGTALKLLWHQQLGHCFDEKLANAHQCANCAP
jgi:hypothetical protein